MGSVYRATDENLGVFVAVKENLFLSDEYARQFRLEANILAGLRHPSLPRVSDHFVIDRQGQYLVMDYIEGEDLRQLLDRSGAPPEDEVIRMGASVCDALTYLHTREPPIVHRDIKPGNIRLTPDGNIVLVDFGLAKLMLDNQSTTTGARAMTPGYSPPEQYGTAHTDPRSDIYSLGATMYVAMTNAVPEDALARATGNADLTNPRKLVPTLNRKLSAAVLKAMAVDPKARYQTAEEFKQALIEAQSQPGSFISRPISTPKNGTSANGSRGIAPSQPVPNGRVDHPKKTVISHWRERVAGLALLVLIVLGGVYGLGHRNVFSPFFAGARPTAEFTPTRLVPESSPSPRPHPTSTLAEVKPLVTATLPQVAAPVINTPALSPTSAIAAESSEQIAFVSERSGSPQLWIMNSDGSNLRQITAIKDGACQPDWAPDGKRLVFISPCPSMASGRYTQYPGSSLHIIHSDGTGQIDLPLAPEGDFDPAWSPDGKEIAFTSLKNGRPRIYSLNLSTNGRTDLSHTAYEDRQPAWSPDGKRLAFVRLYGSEQIWIMNADGSNQKQVTRSNDLNDFWPAWTPDGEILFFGQSTSASLLPWLMAIRQEDFGTDREFKVPAFKQTDFGFIAQAQVSPDNHWIVFEGWSGPDSHEIWVMTVSGAERQPLTSGSSLNYSPVWSPAIK